MQSIYTLIDLYAFGLRHICPEFVNAIITCVAASNQPVHFERAVTYVYQNETTADTPLCQLLVEQARRFDIEVVLRHIDPQSDSNLALPPDFVRDFLVATLKEEVADRTKQNLRRYLKPIDVRKYFFVPLESTNNKSTTSVQKDAADNASMA